MGTNYYLVRPGPNPCEHCGRSDNPERLHIGKSSGGWCFSLHVDPANGINDLDDWEKLFQTGRILSEYEGPITPIEMSSVIRERENPSSWENRYWNGMSEREFHFRNGSERGPNGMLRHALGNHCIKHGEGTWDCILGEFS